MCCLLARTCVLVLTGCDVQERCEREREEKKRCECVQQQRERRAKGKRGAKGSRERRAKEACVLHGWLVLLLYLPRILSMSFCAFLPDRAAMTRTVIGTGRGH